MELNLTRWLWYVSLALGVAALSLLAMGVVELLSPAELEAGGAESGVEGTAEAGAGTTGPSALIRAAKEFSRRWEPPTGTVTVVLEPEAVQEKGRWKVGESLWKKSGESLEGVPAGNQQVLFSPVSGWQTPGSKTIELARDQELKLTAEYPPPPPSGTVRVVLGPEGATAVGAQWRVQGGQWQASGATSSAPVGEVKVEFKPLALWDSPAAQAVEVEKDELSELTGSYVAKPQGGIEVQIVPAEAVETGRWRVNEGPWQSSGAVVKSLLVGRYQVKFEPMARWRAPQDIAVQVAADEVVLVEASYEGIPTGSVQVMVGPEGAEGEGRWRLNNGLWQKSGELVGDVEVGTHQVELMAVEGWTAPGVQPVEVLANETVVVSAEYERVRPPAPTFTVDTTIMIGEGGGMAWFNVPGEKELKLVAVGESVGEYCLEEIGDGWVELGLEGFRYRLEVPLPEEKAGDGTGAFTPVEKAPSKSPAAPKAGAPDPGAPNPGGKPNRPALPRR